MALLRNNHRFSGGLCSEIATETEAEHIDSQIPYPGKGGCAQFYFSHMPQENGIGDINKLFDKDAHHYGEADEPDILVCIVHCST